MHIETTALPGLKILSPKVYHDDRGSFFETFQQQRFADCALPHYVQDNQSVSKRGVIRGMHYQLNFPQGKLFQVLSGRVIEVIADVCPSSPTFKQIVCIELDSDQPRQVVVPPGYAHGFGVLSEIAVCSYKCTDYYHPEDEKGIRWDDPALAIPWTIDDAIVSDKDRELPCLGDASSGDLPPWEQLTVGKCSS